jgi:OmpA-OmpF porin, OOP family
VYVNGAKIWDVQEAFGELKYNTIAFVLGDYENDAQHYLITNLKLAEAGADTRHKLIETGTFSTNEILFDTNKATIKSSSEKILAELGEALKLTPEFKVMIIGHTDGDGKEADNQKLSEKRAESVKNCLVSKFGIDVSRIQTSGKGESHPLADNTSEDGKAKNRRVEFKKM